MKLLCVYALAAAVCPAFTLADDSCRLDDPGEAGSALVQNNGLTAAAEKPGVSPLHAPNAVISESKLHARKVKKQHSQTHDEKKIDMQEQKIDPFDNDPCTYAQLKEKYAGEYEEQELKEYWSSEMLTLDPVMEDESAKQPGSDKQGGTGNKGHERKAKVTKMHSQKKDKSNQTIEDDAVQNESSNRSRSHKWNGTGEGHPPKDTGPYIECNPCPIGEEKVSGWGEDHCNCTVLTDSETKSGARGVTLELLLTVFLWMMMGAGFYKL